MKNTFLLLGALFLGVAVNAQTSPKAPTPVLKDTVASTTTTAPTTLVDTSVGKAYVAHPDQLLTLTSETLTPAHVFPALGTYKGTGTSTAQVTITLDSINKGIVWVDGLQQGKFKALMKKAPSTYKIPAQKSATGKDVSEGTLYVNPDTYELTVVLGRPFNDADPTASLTIDPKKKTGWQYTGVKNEAAVAPSASSQQ